MKPKTMESLTFIQQNTFTVIDVKSVLYQSTKHGVELSRHASAKL